LSFSEQRRYGGPADRPPDRIIGCSRRSPIGYNYINSTGHILSGFQSEANGPQLIKPVLLLLGKEIYGALEVIRAAAFLVDELAEALTGNVAHAVADLVDFAGIALGDAGEILA
jgi:hypothetical protein